jgi:endonuclease/exonuclease/phosphatase family metal-dependent hydrolase
MQKLLIVIALLFVAKAYGKTNLTVMSYNVQNLFDTTHDEGKNDYTYLPLAVKKASKEIQAYCNSIRNDYYRKNCLTFDWSEEALNGKIQNLAKVITSYNRGMGADVVAFQEVENKNVLQMLIDRGLKDKGYKYISLIEGPDSRGIDTGLISKYPIVDEKLHIVDMTGIAKKTRGILETTLDVNGTTVTIFGNHWPSQANPDEARFKASEVLLEKALGVSSDLVLVTGDFNTLPDDAPNAIENLMPYFYDAETEARKFLFRYPLMPGTHWYKGKWSSLDRIFVLKSSLSRKVKPKFRLFRTIHYKFQFATKELVDRDTGEVSYHEGVPQSYDPTTKKGYADHLPIVMKFGLR